MPVIVTYDTENYVREIKHVFQVSQDDEFLAPD